MNDHPRALYGLFALAGITTGYMLRHFVETGYWQTFVLSAVATYAGAEFGAWRERRKWFGRVSVLEAQYQRLLSKQFAIESVLADARRKPGGDDECTEAK